MDERKTTALEALDKAVEHLNQLEDILTPYFELDKEDFYLFKHHIEKLKEDMERVSDASKYYMETGKLKGGK